VKLVRGAVGIALARYESGRIGMSDNGLPLPESKFATVDVGMSVPISAGMSVQMGVRNLFDRNYFFWGGLRRRAGIGIHA
jgi:outer membrane receptor protein involved in Fe transport